MVGKKVVLSKASCLTCPSRKRNGNNYPGVIRKAEKRNSGNSRKEKLNSNVLALTYL